MTSAKVSARLDGLVRGRVERSYLKGEEGFWADEVLREFVFLEERGLELEEILFHQNGSAMTYRDPHIMVVLEYASEFEPPYINAAIGIARSGYEGLSSVDRLVVEHDPATALPPRPPTDRAAVRANVLFWADGIRMLLDRQGGPAV